MGNATGDRIQAPFAGVDQLARVPLPRDWGMAFVAPLEVDVGDKGPPIRRTFPGLREAELNMPIALANDGLKVELSPDLDRFLLIRA
jgi:hypothetical protein